MAEQLAGWIVIAPLSGALRWRPHVWLTGPFESGKSFVLQDIVGRLLKGVSVPVSGAVTEAGIRQALGGRSWPVLLDEAEGKDERAANRLSAVLELMRSAASQEGAVVVKGGTNGKATHWRVRSAFALASIDPSIAQSADSSRIVRLALNGPRDRATPAEIAERGARFASIKATLLQMERICFGQRLIWRSLRGATAILGNADVFAAALAARTNSGRTADTLGPILAGWYSLTSDAALTLDQAKAIVASLPWISAAAERGATERDHDAAWRHLVGCQVRNDSGQQRTIGELVDSVARFEDESKDHDLLLRHGLRVDRTGQYGDDIGILFCRGHGALKSLFHGTQWLASPIDTLAQHPHAQAVSQPVRFGSGIKNRAVRLNLTKLGFFE